MHPREPHDPTERVSDRVFRLLRALHELGTGAHSLQRIVSSTQLSRSTVQRILQSGLREGVIAQRRHGTYFLRPQAGRDRTEARTGMFPTSRASRGELRNLRHRTGHDTFLYGALLADVPLRICIETSSATGDTLHALAARGHRAPLNSDAPGLAILADLVGSVRNNPMLSRIRAEGFAETPAAVAGWRLIAVPLRRFNFPVGAISMGVEEGVSETARIEYIDALRATARRLDGGPGGMR